jgi:murein DD-endopeptidase MepM/ murein hydrolase activator NlpD
LLNFKIMKNIDNWLTKHKTEVFVVFILLFIFLFFYIPYRPGFIKVKDAPEQIADVRVEIDGLKNIMIAGFAGINNRLDKQDIVNQRIPKLFPAPGAKISSNYQDIRINAKGDTVKHWGIDIAQPKGSPIYAPVTGKVIQAKWEGGYGNCTILDSGIFRVKIGHQDKIYVALNQEVKQGDLIGTTGNTGFSFGAHQHIEIEQEGEYRDPKPFMQ